MNYTQEASSSRFQDMASMVAGTVGEGEQILHCCVGRFETRTGLALSFKAVLTLMLTNSLIRALGKLREKHSATGVLKILFKCALIIGLLLGLFVAPVQTMALATILLGLYVLIRLAANAYNLLFRFRSMPDLLIITDQRHIVLQGIDYDKRDRLFFYHQCVCIPREKVLKAPLKSRLFSGLAFAADFPVGDPQHFAFPDIVYKVPVIAWLARSFNRTIYELTQSPRQTAFKLLDSAHLSSTQFVRKNIDASKLNAIPLKARTRAIPGRFSPRRIPAAVLVILALGILFAAVVPQLSRMH